MHNEQWKQIAGFAGYEISDHGRVRSCDRQITTREGQRPKQRRTLRGKLLGRTIDARGYHRVCLWRGNRQFGRIVHRLVVEAFIRKIGRREQVNHLDCDKANNTLANLEITTFAGNMQHAMRAGRMAKKLNARQVRQIRLLVASGKNKEWVAERFGVTRTNVNSIVFGRTWQWVAR
jgi:hypothetical protein